MIVDHLVDKIVDKGNLPDIDKMCAKNVEESRKAELVFLLNEVIGGKTCFFHFF